MARMGNLYGKSEHDVWRQISHSVRQFWIFSLYQKALVKVIRHCSKREAFEKLRMSTSIIVPKQAQYKQCTHIIHPSVYTNHCISPPSLKFSKNHLFKLSNTFTKKLYIAVITTFNFFRSFVFPLVRLPTEEE